MGKNSAVAKAKALTLLVILLAAAAAGIFLSLLYFPGTCGRESSALPTANAAKIDAAVSYLKTHYDNSTGLFFESENGSREAAGRTYALSQTFWIYSDNLLASDALRPYDPRLAAEISSTIRSFGLPHSGFFEVLFGSPIPLGISVPENLVVASTNQHVIMAEVHNSSSSLVWQAYGNTLVYQSLNEYLRGDRPRAIAYLCQAYRLWNGTGVADLALPSEGYATYKLALILYASEVLGLSLPDHQGMESKLWSMQASNGGIITLSDAMGHHGSSANTETTSMALLPYDIQLVGHMRSLLGCVPQHTC